MINLIFLFFIFTFISGFSGYYYGYLDAGNQFQRAAFDLHQTISIFQENVLAQIAVLDARIKRVDELVLIAQQSESVSVSSASNQNPSTWWLGLLVVTFIVIILCNNRSVKNSIIDCGSSIELHAADGLKLTGNQIDIVKLKLDQIETNNVYHFDFIERGNHAFSCVSSEESRIISDKMGTFQQNILDMLSSIKAYQLYFVPAIITVLDQKLGSDAFSSQLLASQDDSALNFKLLLEQLHSVKQDLNVKALLLDSLNIQIAELIKSGDVHSLFALKSSVSDLQTEFSSLKLQAEALVELIIT